MSTRAGMRVPEHGCVGEARRKLGQAGGEREVGTLVERLTRQVARRSSTDLRVRTAFERWSDCMTKSGYDYADP